MTQRNLCLYVLRVSDESFLERAFGTISDTSAVSSSIAEPRLKQMRFTAPPREGDRLAERIYLQGGMVWCSRHQLDHRETR